MTRCDDRSPDGPVTRNVAAVDFGLFAPQSPRSDMVRHPDRATSRAAAVAVEEHLSKLQAMVMAALEYHGPMTDEELERLQEFAGCSPSTVRKRRSELAAMQPPKIIDTETRRFNSSGTATLIVWRHSEAGA